MSILDGWNAKGVLQIKGRFSPGFFFFGLRNKYWIKMIPFRHGTWPMGLLKPSSTSPAGNSLRGVRDDGYNGVDYSFSGKNDEALLCQFIELVVDTGEF